MKKYLALAPLALTLAAMTLALTTHAQKITTFTEPDNQKKWVISDAANLNAKVISGADGICQVSFRMAGDAVYMYIQGRGGSIGAQDYAAFYMATDTITVHSTGPQAAKITVDQPTPAHEYTLTIKDLQRISQAGNLKKVDMTDFAGVQQISISKNPDRLAAYAAALLKAKD